MGMLEDYYTGGICGSALGGLWGAASFPQYLQQLAAMQQQRAFDSFAFQRQQAAQMAGIKNPFFYREHPKRKIVESKTIETVEIRPEQDVKLLKAGNGI